MNNLLYLTPCTARFLGRALLAALISLSALVVPGGMASPRTAEEGLMPYFELKPIEIVGEEIPITVYARNGRDRRYATKFAHSVVEVVYVTLEGSPGSGLVVMGDAGEPHPLRIFERFLQVANEAGASDELRQTAEQVEVDLEAWRKSIPMEGEGEVGDDLPIDRELLMNAFPMGLNGALSEVYLMAWEEEFLGEQMDLRFRDASASGGRSAVFDDYDWVFYLPPRNAFDKVIKDVVPKVMKKEKIGFLKRSLIRGALATFKPLIRDAVEGMRRGIFYYSVMHGRPELNRGDVEQLSMKYVESQMPRGRVIPGDKVKRGIEAVEAQKIANEEYAKDLYVAPSPLVEYEPERYQAFLGEYLNPRSEPHQFYFKDGAYHWQYLDRDPRRLTPAGPALFVAEDGSMSLEIKRNEHGVYDHAEQRWDRFREILTRPAESVAQANERCD